jgi:Lrp/AsnC family leucine-responsive transcriptional regulator
MIDLDRHDLALLARLQHDGRATHQALADAIHLSASQVGRRIQRLEDLGLLERCVWLLRPAKLGLDVTAFTRVSLDRHTEADADAFIRALGEMREVLECYSVTGPHDFLLKVVAADLASFSRFMMQRLMRAPGVRSVESTVVLREIKRTTELPLPS